MDLLGRSLQRFYANVDNFNALYDITRPESGRRSDRLSLRVVECLVTNYSKTHRVEFEQPDNALPFNLYMSYREQLAFYSKRMFDPFARRNKTTIRSPAEDEREITTTPGQMNFFRWAITNGVLEYARQHQDAIREELPKGRERRPSLRVLNGKVIRCRKRCKASDLAILVRPSVKSVKKKFTVRFL